MSTIPEFDIEDIITVTDSEKSQRDIAKELGPKFAEMLNLIENTNQNILILGKAGTGKSTLLNTFCEITEKKAVVLAPTGIAALNVKGATLHSFFRFPLEVLTEKSVKFMMDKQDLFNNLETIIIDEISMVRADIMDAIDISLRLNTGSKAPFGGLQVVLLGDPYQLPPVIVGSELERYFIRTYGGPHFFQAPAFEKGKFHCIELFEVFRQKDKEFKLILNRMRNKEFTKKDLAAVNKRLMPDQWKIQDQGIITIATTNKTVDYINQMHLDALDTPSFHFHAKITGNFSTKDCPTPADLELKAKAQIMFTKNDSDGRWMNGTLGYIEEISDNEIKAKIDDTICSVKRETWEAVEYDYVDDELKRKVIGTFTQYPIKLAWAATVHKSQGMTYDRVHIDFGKGTFAHGQAYVALSRCTSLQGITLERAIRHRDFIVDDDIVEFMNEVRTKTDKRRGE